VQRAFVVPDGVLSLVSFAALPASRSRYLVEAGPRIHYLTSERDLVREGDDGPRNRDLLALGSPDFDAATLFAALPENATRLGPVENGGNTGDGCRDLRSIRFEPLPSAETEIHDITTIWSGASPAGNARSLTGKSATEAAFKDKAPGNRIIHLATHGFFLTGRCSSVAAGRRGIGGLSPKGDDRPIAAVEGESLRLSGLALAGANHRDAAGAGEDDGILTAEEIASIDLRGVEWAVLSACDTGVGQIRAGEGVFGLRRAFVVAGTRAVVMSLWAVEDEAARRWMKRLYTARWAEGMSTADAVHEASLEELEKRRSEGESTHPFFWAGFVAAGEWR
jgi:CHAT domain-containing protein